MASHTPFAPKKSASSAARSNTREFGAPTLTHSAVRAGEPVTSRVSRGLSAMLDKPSLVVIVILGALVVGGAGTGAIQSVVSPRYIVTVQQFEITPEASKRLGVTGKGAADLVIDRLDRTAMDASSFHGAEYYAYDHHGTQPIALDEGIRVPVQSSYDIEVHGISVDTIVKAYRRLRYKEWLISGDVLTEGEGYVVRMRLNRDDDAESWQANSSGPTGVMERIQGVTDSMLAEESPELFGSAYLQQRHYPEAADVFRKWAVREPANWRPFYYLSLAYDSEEKEQEAANLAQWSRNVAEHEEQTKGIKTLMAPVANSASAAALAEVTQAVWETRDEPAGHVLSASEKSAELHQLQTAEGKLSLLCAGKQPNVTYELQLAKVLAKEADMEAESSPGGSEKAYERQARAVALLAASVQKMPGNGGLHEQHAVLLRGLAGMGKTMSKDPKEIAQQEADEVAELRRALELRPTQVSPLWGALYTLIKLGRDNEAVDLTRTMTLLQPESTEANTAHVMALEHAMKTSGGSPAKETEMAEHLDPLLETATDFELQALWNSFKDQNDDARLQKVANAGLRRFPLDKSFRVTGATAPLAAQLVASNRH